MNWGQLKAQAQATVHRSDLDWQGIQELAAAEIFRDLDVIDNENMAPLTVTQETGTPLWSAPLPADFQRVKALIGAGRELPWSATDLQALFMREQRAGWFAISGGKVYMGGPGPVVLIYGQSLPLMTADDATNVILTKYPNVYLHGLVKWAYQRVQDMDLMAIEAQQLGAAIEAANADKDFQTRPAGMAPQIIGSY